MTTNEIFVVIMLLVMVVLYCIAHYIYNEGEKKIKAEKDLKNHFDTIIKD